jgi:hypothetical protein
MLLIEHVLVDIKILMANIIDVSGWVKEAVSAEARVCPARTSPSLAWWSKARNSQFGFDPVTLTALIVTRHYCTS